MVGKLDLIEIFKNESEKPKKSVLTRASLTSKLIDLLNSMTETSLNDDEEVKEIVNDILNGKKEE